jgi:3-methylfumaryl-CoA hydratase
VGILLTEATRAWADRTYPVHEVTITANDIRRFAHATGETDPVHFDADAARAAGYPDVVAPPMFYVFLRVQPNHLRPRDELEADGSPSEDIPPVAIQGAMAGSTTLEVTREFVAGDVIACHKRLVDAVEKSGSKGPLLFLTFEHRYVDAEGTTVVREVFTRILR